MDTEPQPGPRLLTGNEAVAYAAVEAGVTFFAGYPITPSSEIAETLAVLLPAHDRIFIQMEDEIAAMGAVIGAALAGAKALTATSGPGFSLKQEAIGYACETEVPCVIANVMRGGPSTGMPTLPAQGDVMQARWGTHGDHPAIALCPERVSEAYELTLRAFDYAERLRTPVILLLDEIVGHVTEKVMLPLPEKVDVSSNRETSLTPEEYKPYRFAGDFPPPLVPFGRGYRFHVTGLLHDETGFPTNDSEQGARVQHWLNGKVDQNRDMLVDYEEVETEDAEILVFAYGACSRSAKGALREARRVGLKAGLFRPRTIWPFPDVELRAAAKGVRAVLVVEMNLGQLSLEVERTLAESVEIRCLHKVGGEPILPEEILEALKEFT